MAAYARWAHSSKELKPLFAEVLLAIPAWPISQRKLMLDYCRTQPAPIHGSRFHRTHSDDLGKPIALSLNHARNHETIPVLQLLKLLEGFMDPVVAGPGLPANLVSELEMYYSSLDTSSVEEYDSDQSGSSIGERVFRPF